MIPAGPFFHMGGLNIEIYPKKEEGCHGSVGRKEVNAITKGEQP